jgi:GNAT superfamily N-acetyltransferase
LLDAGTTPGDAQRNLARNKEMLFDGDDLVDGHYVFNAVDDDTVVGVLWIADKLDPVAKDWYIYDIEVDKAFRGKGYGRLTMQAAEAVRDEPRWQATGTQCVWPQYGREKPL